MMKTGTVPILNSMIAVGLAVLTGVFSDARPALAQTQEACPLPDGVTPPADPRVTAQQVEDGSASLKDFVLAARDRYKTPTSTLEEALYFQCRVRQEGSPWRSGSTYLVQLTPDGRVYEHSKSMALSGRLLNPLIYAQILTALGVSPTVLADLASPDPAVKGGAFGALFGALAQEPDAPFDATSLGIPGASGHAAVSILGSSELPILLLAGFDLDESHLVEEVPDYGDPAVTARDVVDRETLKAFVTQAGEWFIPIVETATDPAAISKVRIAARDPNGPWRHGPVYLYVLDLTSNIILFHGAFPDRFEWRPLVATVRDAVTGWLILPQVIEAAKSSPEGGFVEYYFDDPTDDSDSADIPKVGYARQFAAEIPRADGTVFEMEVIIGSGFYGREPEVVPDGPVTAVEATVIGDAVEGLTVEFSRSVSGRSRNYAWKAVTDAAGRASLTISSPRRVGGFYQARARNAAGEIVGQWNSIPLNRNRRQVLELTLGGGMRVVRGRTNGSRQGSGLGRRAGLQCAQSLQQLHADCLPGVEPRPGAVGDLQRAGPAGAHAGGRVPGGRLLPGRVGCPRPAGRLAVLGDLHRPPELPRRGAVAAAALPQVARNGSAGSVSPGSRLETW